MTEPAKRVITFVGCNETPSDLAHYAGRTYVVPDGYVLPCVGFRGLWLGVPGVLLAGDLWEIRPTDMRAEEEMWLDEAAELLREEPSAGDRLDVVQTRLLRAHLLIMKAQLAVTRRQVFE